MSRVVVIRADASPRIGAGHAVRMVAIAQWLKQDGWSPVLVVAETVPFVDALISASGVEVARLSPAQQFCGMTLSRMCRERGACAVVIDGYSFDDDYRAAVRSAPVLAVEDRWVVPRGADIWINPNIYSGQLPHRIAGDVDSAGIRYHGGPQYVIVRPEVAVLHDEGPRTTECPRRILCMFGGVGKREMVRMAIEGTGHLDADWQITIVGATKRDESNSSQRRSRQVIMTPSTPVIAPLIRNADIAVTAAGSTTAELACAGVAMIALPLADNQQPVSDALRRLEAALVIDGADVRRPAALRNALNRLISDADLRTRLSTNAWASVDGRGGQRFSELIRSL